jgi:hypothetical protein
MKHIGEFDLPTFAVRQKIWATAESGEEPRVVEILSANGLSISRTDLFCTAARERKRLLKFIADNQHANDEAAQAANEYQICLACRSNATDPAKQAAKETAALNKQAALRALAGEVSQAKVYLSGIQQRFSPFLSDRELLPPVTDSVPPAVEAELKKLLLSENNQAPWFTEFEEVRRPKKPPKRIVSPLTT